MNKELSKVIVKKFRMKNKYLKLPSEKKYLTYKRIKNKCKELVKTKEKAFSRKC